MLSLLHQREVSSRTVKKKTTLICIVLINFTESVQVAAIHTLQRNEHNFLQKVSVTFSISTKIIINQPIIIIYKPKKTEGKFFQRKKILPYKLSKS